MSDRDQEAFGAYDQSKREGLACDGDGMDAAVRSESDLGPQNYVQWRGVSASCADSGVESDESDDAYDVCAVCWDSRRFRPEVMQSGQFHHSTDHRSQASLKGHRQLPNGHRNDQ